MCWCEWGRGSLKAPPLDEELQGTDGCWEGENQPVSSKDNLILLGYPVPSGQP